eukprot:10169-Heterococcus_DN1.PRE.2
MLTDKRECEQLDSCCGRSWRLCARRFVAVQADSEPCTSYATAERSSSCCAVLVCIKEVLQSEQTQLN